MTSSLATQDSPDRYLAKFKVLAMNRDQDVYNDLSFHTYPIAAECQLYPSIQTLSAIVQESVLTETILSEVPFLEENWCFADLVLRDGSWQPSIASDHYSEETPYALNASYSCNHPSHLSHYVYYSSECIWQVGESVQNALASALEGMFHNKTAQASADRIPWDDRFIDGDPWIVRAYNNGSANIDTITGYFQGLASSLTVYARQGGIEQASAGSNAWSRKPDNFFFYLYGDALTMETCVDIQWWWLSVPAGLLVASILFVGATYWHTIKQRHGAGTWKTVPVANLFVGLEEDLRNRYGRLDKVSNMERVASELQVQLCLTEGGWRLKEAVAVEQRENRNNDTS